MLFLLGLLAVAVIGGLTLGIAVLAGVGDDDDTARSTTSTAAVTGPALAAGQVAVTGTATNVSVIGAVVDSVVVGQVTTPSAGLGAAATFQGVLVDGVRSTISWDAGRPLTFAPSTPLRLRPAPINLTAGPASMTVAFPDGAVHRLEPGEYELQTPVAVGSDGLATPMERVTFTATQDSTVSFTGGASATILPIAMSVRGPGQVGIEGTLLVRRPDDTVTQATQVGLPAGSFELTLTPAADGSGYDLGRVILEGEVAVV